MTTNPNPDRYRRRTEIEARQWTGSNTDAMSVFCSPFDFQTIDPEDRVEDPDQTAAVRTHPHGGWVGLKPGDWVVREAGRYTTASDEEFRTDWELVPPAAVPVAAPPTTEQTALRERIAAAVREHYLCTNRDEADADGNLPCRCGDWREPGAEVDDENDWDSHLADAVLAVLPAPADLAAVCICGHTEAQHFEDVCVTEVTGCDCGDFLTGEAAREVIARWRDAAIQARADRAAILTEAADEAERVAESLRKHHEFERSTGALDVMTELRRVAAVSGPCVAGEQQNETPEAPVCGRTKSVAGTEYPPCGREPGHEEAYCRSADGKQHFLAVGYDDYERTTGHLITCLAVAGGGSDPDCPCARPHP